MNQKRANHQWTTAGYSTVILLLIGLPVASTFGVPPADEPINVTDDMTPPERIRFSQPVYPEAARKEGLEGEVVLELIITRKGDVEVVKAKASDPLFEEAAVDAVKKWKYLPAKKDGKGVSVYYTVTVRFSLDGKKQKE